MKIKKLSTGRKNQTFYCLIFIFCILIIPVSASVTTDENVWVIRTSGNIGINERIEFNGFSVKIHEFHDESISLAIYKNNKFIELFDFYENESRQYEDLRVEVLKIDNSSALIAISTSDKRTVWRELEPAHAFWGDYIQRDKYGIEVISFNNDSVNLTIYENGNKLTEETYFANTEHEYLDDFKIYVSNIDTDGYVDIRFFKKLPLSIIGNLETEKDVYRPDEHINCQVEIFNSGDVPINLVDVNVTTRPDVKIKNPGYPINNLLPNQSHVFEFLLTPSAKNEDSNVMIKAKVTLIDYFGKKYTYNFSKNIYVSSSIGIIKEVNPSELELQDNSRETSNVAMVKLTIFNVGTTSRNLMIYDSIPDDLRLYNSSSLEWNRIITPGEMINITYYIIPDVPGKYILPPAEVLFNNKSLYSAGVTFTVHGPMIYFNKTANIVNNTVIINNFIQNVGDRAAYVMVVDNPPQGSNIIDGSDFWDDVMQPGESGKFNYSIHYYKGLNTLPGAIVQYQDIRGNSWHFESKSIELRSIGNDSKITKKDLIIFLFSSYFVILGLVVCILVLIGAVIYTQGEKHD